MPVARYRIKSPHRRCLYNRTQGKIQTPFVRIQYHEPRLVIFLIYMVFFSCDVLPVADVYPHLFYNTNDLFLR